MLIVNNAVDALITVFTRITIRCGSRFRKFDTYLNHFPQGRPGSVYVLIQVPDKTPHCTTEHNDRGGPCRASISAILKGRQVGKQGFRLRIGNASAAHVSFTYRRRRRTKTLQTIIR